VPVDGVHFGVTAAAKQVIVGVVVGAKVVTLGENPLVAEDETTEKLLGVSRLKRLLISNSLKSTH
jgi:hypothetical protein